MRMSLTCPFLKSICQIGVTKTLAAAPSFLWLAAANKALWSLPLGAKLSKVMVDLACPQTCVYHYVWFQHKEGVNRLCSVHKDVALAHAHRQKCLARSGFAVLFSATCVSSKHTLDSSSSYFLRQFSCGCRENAPEPQNLQTPRPATGVSGPKCPGECPRKRVCRGSVPLRVLGPSGHWLRCVQKVSRERNTKLTKSSQHSENARKISLANSNGGGGGSEYWQSCMQGINVLIH